MTGDKFTALLDILGLDNILYFDIITKDNSVCLATDTEYMTTICTLFVSKDKHELQTQENYFILLFNSYIDDHKIGCNWCSDGKHCYEDKIHYCHAFERAPVNDVCEK